VEELGYLARGNVRGLDDALRDWLQRYFGGDQTSGGIQLCVLSLPLELWAWWGWIEVVISPSTAAGTATNLLLFTVPDDERVMLNAVLVDRETGDNEASYIEIVYPAAYSNGGTARQFLTQLVATASGIYWPRGDQAILAGSGPEPVLLEPGTMVRVRSSTVGAAATTFRAQITMRRTKLIRALAP